MVPNRIRTSTRHRIDRARPGEPDMGTFVAGVSAFLLIAAACLYFVTHVAP